MNTPYYFTTDDKTKKTYNVYTTDVLEPTEETRTLVKSFRYTIKAAPEVYEKVICFVKSHMMQTGGCHLFQAWEAATAIDVSTDEGMLISGAMPSDIYDPLAVQTLEAQEDEEYEESEDDSEEQEEQSLYGTPDYGSTEDMLQAGAMPSDIYDPLEVCKPEVQEVPQETPAARAKRRIKESSVLRQALALVKELDNSQRTTCIVYAREHNMSSNLAELTDEQAQAWIDFILNMLHMEALTDETVKREAKLSQAIAAYNKAEKPQIVTTATKKATAKKVGKEVHDTSGDKVVSIKTRQPVQPVEAAPVVEKKPAKQPVEKPVKEAKKPVEKAIPSSLVTPEQEAACLVWDAGEYPGMVIPAGFRVRKEKETGLYRVDHWNGSQWHTYINKAGKIGYTRFASELKQWFEKWMIQLGIAA